MLNKFKTYTSLSCDDLGRALGFYENTLGLTLEKDASPNALFFKTGGDTRFMVYTRKDHRPADFTVLNFAVQEIESVVGGLSKKGVTFEKQEGTNAQGIASHGDMKMAWLKDPFGNWLCLSQGG